MGSVSILNVTAIYAGKSGSKFSSMLVLEACSQSSLKRQNLILKFPTIKYVAELFNFLPFLAEFLDFINCVLTCIFWVHLWMFHFQFVQGGQKTTPCLLNAYISQTVWAITMKKQPNPSPFNSLSIHEWFHGNPSHTNDQNGCPKELTWKEKFSSVLK